VRCRQARSLREGPAVYVYTHDLAATMPPSHRQGSWWFLLKMSSGVNRRGEGHGVYLWAYDVAS